MARLIGYCRVSSRHQIDNTSLPSQKRILNNFCSFSGHELIEVIEEQGSGATVKKRPQFRRILDRLKRDEADGLIVSTLDRFARSSLDGLKTITELKQHGKELVVTDLHLDTSTPLGQFMVSILLAVAQLDRDLIQARCKAGRQRAREAGYIEAGPRPFGYRISGKPGQKTFEPDPIEHPLLLQIHQLHLSGFSYGSIARKLNAANILTPRGKKWSAQTVKEKIERLDRIGVSAV